MVNIKMSEDSTKLDIALDIEMAYLDLDEKKRNLNESQFQNTIETSTAHTNDEHSTSLRRSRRKIIHPLNTENRRSVTKPRKLIDGSYKETVSYYLDKRVKRLPSTLETIFEDPQCGVIMSGRKLKRCISFQDVGTLTKDKNKIKKRSMKVKKIQPVKSLKKLASMDLLIQKLQGIDKTE